MKRISKEELRLLAEPAGLTDGIILNRLHKHYCVPRNRRNQCSRQCRHCQDDICHILAGASARDIGDPYAMIVWGCREAIADLDDLAEKRAAPRLNALGETVDVSPFAAFLESV
jgi:hypothetical protein